MVLKWWQLSLTFYLQALLYFGCASHFATGQSIHYSGFRASHPFAGIHLSTGTEESASPCIPRLFWQSQKLFTKYIGQVPSTPIPPISETMVIHGRCWNWQPCSTTAQRSPSNEGLRVVAKLGCHLPPEWKLGKGGHETLNVAPIVSSEMNELNYPLVN